MAKFICGWYVDKCDLDAFDESKYCDYDDFLGSTLGGSTFVSDSPGDSGCYIGVEVDMYSFNEVDAQLEMSTCKSLAQMVFAKVVRRDCMDKYEFVAPDFMAVDDYNFSY